MPICFEQVEIFPGKQTFATTCPTSKSLKKLILTPVVLLEIFFIEQGSKLTFFFLKEQRKRQANICYYLPDGQVVHHITCWIRYFPRRQSWPDFVWLLSLLFLAISFDHMHPLSPVHFSSSHSLPAFSTFVSVFLFLYYHHFKFQSLHYHIFIFFPQN